MQITVCCAVGSRLHNSQCTSRLCTKMAVLKYLKKRDGTLPDPYGRLSDFIEPCVIQQINDEVSEQSESPGKPSQPSSQKKTTPRGKYAVYSPKQRAEVGKYALENGPAAAFRKFNKDIPSLTQTSVRNFRTAYQRSLTSKREN